MRHFATVKLLCGLEIDAKRTRGFLTRYLCSFDGKGYFLHHTGAQKCIYTYRYRWSFLISVIGFISFAAADIAAVEWIRRIISYIDSDDESAGDVDDDCLGEILRRLVHIVQC